MAGCGETLFEIEEALSEPLYVYLLRCRSNSIVGSPFKNTSPGKALYFRALVSPSMSKQALCLQRYRCFSGSAKGSGTSPAVCSGAWLNSSYYLSGCYRQRFDRVIFQIGIAVGSGYLFETDFKKEVYSDLTESVAR